MKKNFLMSSLFGAFVLTSTLSYASCVDMPGFWNCFPKDDTTKISDGDCRNLECPDGCVEASDGSHGHCCQKVTETDCRMTHVTDGCIRKIKIQCSPNQYCDKQGKCQEKDKQ